MEEDGKEFGFRSEIYRDENGFHELDPAFRLLTELYCYEEWNPNVPVDARGMSDGTLRFAAIVVALLTIKP